MDHLSRLLRFEQEKKKKLEAAKAERDRTEMEGVTFQPVLIAKQRASKARHGRSTRGSLAVGQGNGCRGALQAKSPSGEANALQARRSMIPDEFDSTTYVATANGAAALDDGFAAGSRFQGQHLASQGNHHRTGSLSRPLAASQGAAACKPVFARLFQDGQKLQTKQEERRKKLLEESLGQYFRPQINQTTAAVAQSIRGRQR